MGQSVDNQYASISLDTKGLEAEVRKRIAGNIALAAEKVKVQVQRNLSTSTRSSGPSQPGEFPHADTGRLRNSIFWRMDGELVAVVGTNLNYGLWLEYGTQGGKTIQAAPGKAFSWVGKDGARVFSKTITLKPMAARSFLRRTLFEMRDEIIRTLAQGGAAEQDVQVNTGGYGAVAQ